MSIIALLAAFSLIFLLGWLLKRSTRFAPRRKQQHNIRAAQRVLQHLRGRSLSTQEELPVVLGTLRKLNPFQFEELILTCCEERGWRIKRNSRYTGDGGIDGRVWIAEDLFLMQAKRYRNYIDTQHIRDFQNVIQRENAQGGLFVHTGQTGALSKKVAYEADTIIILSGRRLVNFVLGKGIKRLEACR
jgi:restriction system protein